MPKDVLVRCRTDESLQWYFVCTGKCWKEVSGGVVDGTADQPHYVYGGMWKNKHAGVSAKKKKKKKEDRAAIKDWSETQNEYITNDRVNHQGKFWICRRSHTNSDESATGLGYRYWKEDTSSPSNSEDSTAKTGDRTQSPSEVGKDGLVDVLAKD